MAKGTVKWFNNAKGYGFIVPESGEADLFAHYSEISMEGYKTLKAGEPVEFELEAGEKGLHAVNIRSMTEAQEEALAESGWPCRKTWRRRNRYLLGHSKKVRGSPRCVFLPFSALHFGIDVLP